MIELNDLTMSYALESSRVNVLSGVDLAIADGETVAIIGPSGSGKTTLLILLAGLEQPERGEIRLDGAVLSTLNADGLADMRRDKLGIIFQSFHLVPSLTALANVALPLDIAGHSQSRERAREMLAKVGLAQRENHYPSQLSGGEQQRVAIARALVHAPKLVLADEPTGNLDLRTGEKVSDILFDLNREAGATLLMVTHDEAIAKRCSRVLRLHEGKLVEEPHALPA
ncbi:predicted ABC-type transport system involved in lysophospholipase L1 biosynthesis, ATPase component [Hahella chejuensis KCTC 2396]|uniref:Predicted ABC-type transport system involved in lysophospholipase L1 biosynthesis, ATPase component n=1 Tax=Hahella chejuensis (strain KCTC 2396) TaxID=349521 RepID=Q2S8D2_HAHCH|nr:ABC transporter ATP-binding protein [Hahella chejuensis]ABC33092.1 predicted ABC-type transport system involved in lysophospholipase L1 biosynthesis, ATPase component [Hahella chejuensis KCTC 2396]